ncbi:MAG TPA: hypothetical protein VF140_03345 [Phycicoccus sp.]|nr:hypothetical protein [Phycicoccus sp.]
MDTMTTKETAMAAAREFCARPWRGSDLAHTGDLLAPVQGRSVPVAGTDVRDQVIAIRFSGVATAPTTGYVYPRLEAPPV